MTTEHEDIRFGVLAVKEGHVTPAQVVEALEIQFNEELSEGKHRRIGEILLAQKLIDQAQLKEILRALNKIRTFAE